MSVFCFVCLLSILCILCFCIVLCIVSPFVYSCLFPVTVNVYRPLPPGRNRIAVNIIYHIVSYHITEQAPYRYRIISHYSTSTLQISYHITLQNKPLTYIVLYHITEQATYRYRIISHYRTSTLQISYHITLQNKHLTGN
jgi:hypothetical protein